MRRQNEQASKQTENIKNENLIEEIDDHVAATVKKMLTLYQEFWERAHEKLNQAVVKEICIETGFPYEW